MKTQEKCSRLNEVKILCEESISLQKNRYILSPAPCALFVFDMLVFFVNHKSILQAISFLERFDWHDTYGKSRLAQDRAFNFFRDNFPLQDIHSPCDFCIALEFEDDLFWQVYFWYKGNLFGLKTGTEFPQLIIKNPSDLPTNNKIKYFVLR